MAPKRYQSDHVDPKPLAQPLHFEFSGRTAQNRFLKAAMTERLSSWDPKDLKARGVPSKNLINVYRRWGEGGFGVILTGNIMVDYDQLEAAGNPIIPLEAPMSGERFDAFKELATQAKRHGALCVAQVSHPGRQVEERINPRPISASDVQLVGKAQHDGKVLGVHFAKPRPASEADIADVVARFAHAAEYLDRAGFDGIELHAAHGYLLAQFLSLTTNRRTDRYGGGSIEDRARIILEIGRAVRERTRSGFVLGIKLNSVEFQDGGMGPEEAREVATLLERAGFDFIELSGGTYEKLAFVHQRESTRRREAFFLDFAEKVVPALTRTRTYITGGLRTAGAMVGALQAVDGVGIARPACQEPRLPADILEGRVDAAIERGIDQQDYIATNSAAGAQIRQLGKDHEPIDLSRKDNVDAFVKDMGVWAEEMAKDSDMLKYGYFDISNVTPVPYGTSLA